MNALSEWFAAADNLQHRSGGDRGPELSPLARAYGAIYEVLRNDTEHVLLELFRADRGQVEAAREEWHAAYPEPDDEEE